MLKVCKFGGSSVAGEETVPQGARHCPFGRLAPRRRHLGRRKAHERRSQAHRPSLSLPRASDLLASRAPTFSPRSVPGSSPSATSWVFPTAWRTNSDAYAATLSRDTSVDELVSRGEYFTARLMAETLGYAFVDAADCVFFGFDGQFDRARTDAAIADALEKNGKIVLPGFYGRVPTGRSR